ncbi:MAG: ABC transporter ATP-binding protein, partial [Psychrobacter sp.]|nr:ABC transporter ATP-binding protein [Psychrobacter sp.]
YNEQRELDNLPKEIAALETEQTQLEEKLADGSWFTQDIDAATAASERLLTIEEEMMNKLERWSTLEG